MNWADPPSGIGLNLVNKTRYGLHVNAYKITEANGQGIDHLAAIQVVVTPAPHYVDPLEKELAETKAVLGDLLQEKLAGLKVYALHWRIVIYSGREPLTPAYLSVAEAKKAADKLAGISHEWATGDSHGTWWESGRYLITEHEIR